MLSSQKAEPSPIGIDAANQVHLARPMIAGRLLTTREAAAYLGVFMSKVNKDRVYGTGAAFIRVGRAVRYRQADLDAWLAANRFTSTSAAQAAAAT